MDDFRFWLGSFDVESAEMLSQLALWGPPLPEPHEGRGRKKLYIDVYQFDPMEQSYAVLLSTATSEQPLELQCWLAYANDIAVADSLRHLDLPVIEAELEFDAKYGKLVLVAPHYPPAGGPFGLATQKFLVMTGVEFEARGDQTDLNVRYRQLQVRPDLVRPAFETQVVPVEFPWTRRAAPAKPAATLEFMQARYPNVAACWPGSTPPGCASAESAWCSASYTAKNPDPTGRSSLPARAREAGGLLARPVAVEVSKSSIFGEPIYRFEDVELMGFRVDLPPVKEADDMLAELISPLNFHLQGAHCACDGDFEYRCATRSIVIEMLRYGKMKSREVRAPLTIDNFMSQHELVVRLLVGRVDDDTAQAREAAVFVPAIFVDNPLSKSVGRLLQGYPKQLADFCRVPPDGAALERVRPDGRGGQHEVPLREIGAVCLTSRIGSAPSDPLLRLSVPPLDDEFEKLSLLGDAVQRFRLPWRQPDFEAVEFRRSFARGVVGERFSSFRSIQVAPLEATDNEQKVWISGEFSLSDVRFQLPSGIATLSFSSPRALPSGHPWKKLCRLIGQCTGSETVGLTSGDWYRIRCAIDLQIDDGLAWS
ncbi:hypothetical protein [Variovorax saccharolyticus]|uniref:hypothetical protein n=1 Tax=Variovorax saccharolyticus TaxID=3053516 RepID=UPI0025763C6A|nr:hypothetical protein [Variovorax sp. J31P216]MDM0026346.1 hypothetical protein [Variovorax sp. J31P216]